MLIDLMMERQLPDSQSARPRDIPLITPSTLHMDDIVSYCHSVFDYEDNHTIWPKSLEWQSDNDYLQRELIRRYLAVYGRESSKRSRLSDVLDTLPIRSKCLIRLLWAISNKLVRMSDEEWIFFFGRSGCIIWC